jgi:hypothetical protein
MDKLSKMALYFIVCAPVLFSLHPAVRACQVDEFYLTTEGPLAASTPENLSEASTHQEKGDQDKLAVMMKSGMVMKLKENIKVQVLERSFERRMLKFKFLDQGTPYWVKDGSLKKIICN